MLSDGGVCRGYATEPGGGLVRHSRGAAAHAAYGHRSGDRRLLAVLSKTQTGADETAYLRTYWKTIASTYLLSISSSVPTLLKQTQLLGRHLLLRGPRPLRKFVLCARRQASISRKLSRQVSCANAMHRYWSRQEKCLTLCSP